MVPMDTEEEGKHSFANEPISMHGTNHILLAGSFPWLFPLGLPHVSVAKNPLGPRRPRPSRGPCWTTSGAHTGRARSCLSLTSTSCSAMTISPIHTYVNVARTACATNFIENQVNRLPHSRTGSNEVDFHARWISRNGSRCFHVLFFRAPSGNSI